MFKKRFCSLSMHQKSWEVENVRDEEDEEWEEEDWDEEDWEEEE